MATVNELLRRLERVKPPELRIVAVRRIIVAPVFVDGARVGTRTAKEIIREVK